VTKRKLALKATCTTLFAVVSLGTSNAALAQSGAAPTNLRVTGVTDWTVALMWETPKGKAPSFDVVQCSNGRSMTVAGSPLILSDNGDAGWRPWCYTCHPSV
jgi:hypothetical protein